MVTVARQGKKRCEESARDRQQSYGERALQPWADRVIEWHRQELDVFVYFNNDMEGHAIKDAQTLIALTQVR